MNFELVLKTVLNSNFFRDEKSSSTLMPVNSDLLKEIKIDNICVPIRMRRYINLWSLSTLDELLNIEPCKILRCRNCGCLTIKKTRKAIFNYLYDIRNIIETYETPVNNHKISKNENLCKYNNTVIRYFPLLKGMYKTSEFYYCFVYKDLSAIKIPKLVDKYYCRKNDLKKVKDLLNVNYDILLCERNIGFKSISSLQNELIKLLHLEKINRISSFENTFH